MGFIFPTKKQRAWFRIETQAGVLKGRALVNDRLEVSLGNSKQATTIIISRKNVEELTDWLTRIYPATRRNSDNVIKLVTAFSVSESQRDSGPSTPDVS